MGLRGRLRRLERAADVQTVELVCPECGAEFKARGDDPLLDFLAHEWANGYGGETYRETPADVVRIANLEHDHSRMINKATGKSWVGELLVGTVRMEDAVPDLSEQTKAERGEAERAGGAPLLRERQGGFGSWPADRLPAPFVSPGYLAARALILHPGARGWLTLGPGARARPL